MKANKAEQQGLVTLLNRLYQDIRLIEQRWHIQADTNDFRPRIDSVHDAVQALTSGHTSATHHRLTVEFLAYDIDRLRFIQASPMPRRASMQPLSPTTALVPSGPAGPATGTPNAGEKSCLADLYKHYSVLFAALLAQKADDDYQARINEADSAFENLAATQDAVKQETGQPVDLEALLDAHIEDDALLRKLLATIGKGRKSRRDALHFCQEAMEQTDEKRRTVEKAHRTYVTGQLNIYENARDMVKNMAASGVNVVGEFVENAIREAQKGGRGR